MFLSVDVHLCRSDHIQVGAIWLVDFTGEYIAVLRYIVVINYNPLQLPVIIIPTLVYTYSLQIRLCEWSFTRHPGVVVENCSQFKKIQLGWRSVQLLYTHHYHPGASGLVGNTLDHRSLPPEFESRCGHTWRVFHLWLRFIIFGGTFSLSCAQKWP